MEASNSKSMILIVVILVILIGGGLAAWLLLKPKGEDKDKEQSAGGGSSDEPLLSGRTNKSGYYTDEQIRNTILNYQKQSGDKKPGTKKPPEPKTVWSESSEGQKLIDDLWQRIQLNVVEMDRLRVKHDIGKPFFTAPMNVGTRAAFKKLFGQLDGVDSEDYLTYPIYGRFEVGGQKLRDELQQFLDRGYEAYNLTNKRDPDESWWIDTLQLNLMYGNRSSHVHTADQIWWFKADRAGLDFFKQMNGHDVGDRVLLRKAHGKAVFNAGYLYALVELWVEEIDRLDRVTRDEAIEQLVADGLIVRTNPNDQNNDQ